MPNSLKTYHFTQFEKQPEIYLAQGYEQIQIVNGKAELDPARPEHVAIIRQYGGKEQQPQRSRK